MPKLRVHSFGMSIDGYGAGSNQRLENPLGIGGLALHEWAFKTRTFHAMVGEDGGETGVDDDFVARGFDNIGAWIIGGMPLGWDGSAGARISTKCPHQYCELHACADREAESGAKGGLEPPRVSPPDPKFVSNEESTI